MLPYLTPPQSPQSTANGCFLPEDGIGYELVGRILCNVLQIEDRLGVGAYGVVYTAVDIRDPRKRYAVKALKKQGLESRQAKFQDQEIQLHREASTSGHTNIVKLYDILEDSEYKYVVLEYCPEGDLFSNITDRGIYVRDDLLAKKVSLQIIDAVLHCHQLGIYHRDLKPENILVTDNGGCVKLADFGLATKDGITTDFGCGSTFYMSPECQQPSPRPFASYASAPNDVWSLGVILVNLTCGRNPWKRACMDDSTFSAYTKDRSFLKTILPISEDLNQILCRIFEPDPQLRITLPELRDLIQSCPSLTLSPVHPSTPPTMPYDPEPLVLPAVPVSFIAPPSPPLSPNLNPSWIPNTDIPSLSTYSSGSTDSGTSVFSHVPSRTPIVLSSFAAVHPAQQKVLAYQQPQYVTPPGYYWFIPQHISRMAGYIQQPFQQHLQHFAPVQVPVC